MFFEFQKLVFLAEQLGQVPGVRFSGDGVQPLERRCQRIQKGILFRLCNKQTELINQILKCGSCLFSKDFSFTGLWWRIKEVRIEFFKVTHLGSREVNLRFQHNICVTSAVKQGIFQIILFKDIAIFTYLNLASGTQHRQGGKNRCVVPAVGFTLEFFNQRFQRRSHPAPVIALYKGQQLLL